MKIIVTGGAGFIGSHVVGAYTKAGHTVAVIDNLSTGKRKNIPDDVAFYEGDVSDEVFVRQALTEFQPEVINHQAGQASVVVSVKEPYRDVRSNILGMVTLLEIAKSLPSFKKIIYANTGGAMYGNPQVLPCDEKHPAQPLSPYGLSKHTAERYLWLYSDLYGLKGTVLRYANVYGPNQDPHGEAGVCAIFTDKMLAGEIPTIFGDGSQLRDYVYVGDVAQANLLALDKGEGHSVNIGTGKPTSTKQVFDALKEVTGFEHEPRHSDMRPGEIQESHLQVDKAKDVLGWEAKTDFSQGIRLTVEWAKNRSN